MPKASSSRARLSGSDSRKSDKSKRKSAASKDRATKLKSRRRVDADDLRWKTVQTSGLSMDEGGGMLMLEELDGVDVEWEEAYGRKVARFVQDGDGSASGSVKGADDDDMDGDDGEEWHGIADSPKAASSASEEPQDSDAEQASRPSFAGVEIEDLEEEDDFDDATLPAWAPVGVSSALKRGLSSLSFANPTPIQLQAIPLALGGRDVVGVAQTGSGKTLAYSLPVLHHLLAEQPSSAATSSSTKRPLAALVLCPTRELALQVTDHLTKLLSAAGLTRPEAPPVVSVGTVVGGLSAQKQRRVLERGCDVLVATPGRLWDLLKADDELAAAVRQVQFLVIDEADRMVEAGHFQELAHIVALTQRAGGAVADEADPLFEASGTALTRAQARDDMQTFVFSATMSKELQINLKRKKRRAVHGSTLEDLVERLDFRDPEPAIVDLAPSSSLVSTVRESYLPCVASEKDVYLYYFLLRYPGRSIVFVNSIDSIRRLVPLLSTLALPVHPLHSQLQQKQRLKNLERFKANQAGILLATDVAARGIDIADVEHVVHFDVPRAADTYVHRSGRTARAQREGFVLMLVSAEERGTWRALMRTLSRDPPELPIELSFLPQLKARLSLAKQIEKTQHVNSKAAHDRRWLIEAAEAMDVDIDPSMLSDDEDPDRAFTGSSKPSAAGLKAELAALLARPLLARGISTRYPTSGTVVVLDQVLRAGGAGGLIGAGTGRAFDDAEALSKKRKGGAEQAKDGPAPVAVKGPEQAVSEKKQGKKAGKMSRRDKIAARIRG